MRQVHTTCAAQPKTHLGVRGKDLKCEYRIQKRLTSFMMTHFVRVVRQNRSSCEGYFISNIDHMMNRLCSFRYFQF